LLANVDRVREGSENAGIWRHRRKDETIIHVEITSYALIFAGRAAEVIVAVDVTQRKRDEAEKRIFMESLAATNRELELRNRDVERATELKSKFLASMSHELRTPLNAIVGFSGLLAEQTAGELNDKQKRFVNHIKQGAGHLLQLINDILDFSKIESGMLEVLAANSSTVDSKHGEKPLILIVDDELPARELIASYLETAGYATALIGSGAEAIAKARQLRPSAITLDILMPGGSGFETLFQLKNTCETAHIPVIVVSVVDQKQMRFTLGAAEYLVKPVQKAALLEAVQKHAPPHDGSSSDVLVVDDDLKTLDLVGDILYSGGLCSTSGI